MSRIGKKPVEIPEGVTIAVNPGSVVISGSKGEIAVPIAKNIKVSKEDNTLVLTRSSESKQTKSDHGTLSARVQNGVKGVTEGWSKTLELVGTGYRPRLEGEALVLAIGFSHPVKFDPPQGIKFTVEENKIIVTGIDRHAVGQISANIRDVRPPEVYKGKGIKYMGEKIRRKAGKAAKTGA
jgi:large subunit ribosomal protein L6